MKRSLLRIAALAACLFGLAGNVNLAAADGSFDGSCSTGWSQGGCTIGRFIGSYGARCDATVKFLGGSASALIVEWVNDLGSGYGWSPWLRVNDTWSQAYTGGGYGTAYLASAQNGRAANYRVRWAGDCFVSF